MADQPFAPIQPQPIKGLRIAVNASNQERLSDARRQSYERLFEALRSDGAQLAEIMQPYSPHQYSIMRCEFRRDLEDYLAHASTKRKTLDEIIAYYESDPQATMKYGISTLLEAAGKSTDDPSYRAALAERARMRRQVAEALADYDACIMTGPTNIMHFVGLPSLALKLCDDEHGLPRGLILYGADERRLLAAALTIETYCSPFVLPRLPV